MHCCVCSGVCYHVGGPSYCATHRPDCGPVVVIVHPVCHPCGRCCHCCHQLNSPWYVEVGGLGAALRYGAGTYSGEPVYLTPTGNYLTLTNRST